MMELLSFEALSDLSAASQNACDGYECGFSLMHVMHLHRELGFLLVVEG